MKLVNFEKKIYGVAYVNALERLLYLTCGEEIDTVVNAKVTQLDENFFHIQYKESDPCDGIDFKVRITETGRVDERYHYVITESVWADDGEFDL